MADVAEIVRDQINSDGHGTNGTDLFTGSERPSDDDIPVNSVFVAPGASTIGAEAVSGDMGAVLYGPVQVLIRNHVYATGFSKAKDIIKSLATATLSNTIGHNIDEGYPLYLGEDAQRVYRWTINLTIIQLPAAFT